MKFKQYTTLVMMGLFLLALTCGCKTARYVEVEKVVKDTITYSHWDSIANERVRLIRDSLLAFRWEHNSTTSKDSTYIKDEVKTKVDEKGNVLGRDSIHIEIRYKDSKELVQIKDSLSRYKELADSALTYKGERDSLLRLQSISEGTNSYIEKGLHGMDLLYFKFGKFLFWAFAISVFGLLLLFIIRKKLG